MSFMMAFGWAGVMLCIGFYLRAKICFLRNMLVPASVAAGVLGCVFVNISSGMNIGIGTDTDMYTAIVNNLFTISFISISLTGASSDPQKDSKRIFKGSVAMGMIWCLLYALTPILAVIVIMGIGRFTDMNPVYGMLIQFAFCQGPGQAASYGTIFEQYGWHDAAVTAITFSIIGFIAAFFVGIPAAKAGIKKGIASHCGTIDEKILRGYLKKDEQENCMINDTTCSSNIETLALHIAVIGVCYIFAVGISAILECIPGFLGSSMSSMMFMNGMYAAYIVKWIMRKLKIDFILDNTLQRKITGWTSDYLVVCAFMSVSVSVISKWLVPILTISATTTVVTLIVCFYFGQRIGGSNDFERTLGIYGTCTGTVPSGISLVRIVDPDLETTTAIELGACNLIMIASTPVYIIILALASGNMKMKTAMICLAACVLVYLILLKATKSWKTKTYSWK